MKQHLIPTTHIDDGFDRQNLSIIRKRFGVINDDRLARMRNALSGRHQVFLDALPILFQCNHPMLPGFVNRKTPCKISGFKPQPSDINVAKTLARSFTLKYDPGIKESIYSIYVMGSVGTIAQSERSDLDIWLCHDPKLSPDDLELLRKKCDNITRWTADQKLEAHFFLMNYDDFKKGKVSNLDKESSGSAQRLLLLDEFYRSSIYVAGRTPLWWYVPTKNEIEYEAHTHTLLDKRFLTPHHVIDFGGVASIPGGEFVGAGIWQLYKAIESPYKSVLKLLLLEAYVSDYPNIQPLSLKYKQQVYQGEMDIDTLDSYIMIYRRIEEYLLSRGHHKRLELARRCFYFKVNCPLSRKSKHPSRPWQYAIIQKLVNEWKWSPEGIRLLDSRNNWKAGTVASERSLLVNELNHSYQFLLEFAQTQGIHRAISAEELTVLGRKLQAAFERRPGKVEWINPHISKDLSEDNISISLNKGMHSQPNIWTAFSTTGSSLMRENASIRSSTSFVELILWCYFNGIIEPHTQLDLSELNTIDLKETQQIISTFQEWLPEPQKIANHEQFFKASQPKKILLLVNVGNQQTSELNHFGRQYLSAQNNALKYGEHEENLVTSIDLISVNSWEEVHVRRYDKESALLDTLKEYLQLTLPGTHHSPPELKIKCIGREHANRITPRLKEWFSEINTCFYSAQGNKQRYIFQLSEHYYVLQFMGMRPTLNTYTNEAQLIRALGDTQKDFSGLKIDSHCLKHSPLPLIAGKMRRNTISVFYRRFDIGMETYIADEKGSITHFIDRGKRKQNPLKPLHRFLRAAINRQARSQPDLLADFGICPIYFHEIRKPRGHTMTIKQTPISQNTHQTNMFEVKAIAFTDDDEHIQYDFYCDDQEFSSRSFQDQLFLVVAQFILSRRNRGEDYPIYITDLDLSLCSVLLAGEGQLQISHYLTVKNDLEAKLNEAIGILVKA